MTVDLVSFPDPTNPNAHPLFWAIDLNCQMTDYAAACSFFDFLMEGNIDQLTGKYTINNQVKNSVSEGISTDAASSQDRGEDDGGLRN